jgi:hypothetical protein
VVGATLADLAVQLVRRDVRAHEVVRGPAQVVESLVELSGILEAVAVLDDAPGQHRGRGRHRQSELDVVARVVPAARQVAADVGPIQQARVASPVHAVRRRQRARTLALVEEQRFLQRLGVVERLRARGANGARANRDDGHRQEPTRRDALIHRMPPTRYVYVNGSL